MLVSAAILCGGKSSRMGVDKALLEIDGTTFLNHLISRFTKKMPVYLSLGEKREYDCRDVDVVYDVYHNYGPLGGLHALLQTCTTEYLFVTTVDLPLADPELMQELAEYASASIDAIIPIEEDGKLHPTCGIYRKSVSEIVEKQLIGGDLKMQDLLQKIRVCFVPVGKLTDGKRKLQNINTKQEYEAFLSREQKEKTILSNRHGIPIVAVSAYSGSGKTTLLEKVIPKLKEKGMRVAIIKHDVHGIEIDKPGKDSDRLAKAGADLVILNSEEKTFRMENRSVLIGEILDEIRAVDIILLEGYKHGNFRRIVLYREGAKKPVAFDLVKTPPFCIVSDRDDWPNVECPVYHLEDTDKVAGVLEELIERELRGKKQQNL